VSPSHLSTIRPECRERMRVVWRTLCPIPSHNPRKETLQFANGNSEDDDDVSDAQSRHASKAKSNGNVERSLHSTRRHMSWHVQTGSGPRGREGRPESALSGQKVPSLAQHQTHLPILPGERKNVQEPREAHHEVLRLNQNVQAGRALVGGKIQTRQALQIAVCLKMMMTFMINPNTH